MALHAARLQTDWKGAPMTPNCSVDSQTDTSLVSRAVALVILSLALMVLPVVAHSAVVTLAWDANTEDDIKGYEIYYGTASRNYSDSIKVGNTTQTTISNVQEGQTYYFTATAYDFGDNESAFSEELVYTIPIQTNEPEAHTISASAGAYGSISPSDSILVDHNSNQTFTIIPDQNYEILDVLVDGASVGALSSYTFTSVTRDRAITASFVATNQAPVANAGPDQTVSAGAAITLNGGNSVDPGGSITSYFWEQIEGVSAELADDNTEEISFDAPYVGFNSETLTFRLTVWDAGGRYDTDVCVITVTKTQVQDSDEDGVPDHEDDFPFNPNEFLDTDKDGTGNNADEDDDNDGMPDTWELAYGLNPLIDDGSEDPDRDEVSNINEYNKGTEPDYHEDNFEPDPPELLLPSDDEIVGLTPYLETMGFSDPNDNDVHRKTQWNITQADDGLCVFDVTASKSLTSITVPKQVLDEDTEYIWKVRFLDNHDTPSDWSEAGYFTTDFQTHDSDGNGVPDHQEVESSTDLDGDGTIDSDQPDIKCVSVNDGQHQICIGIRGAEHVESIVSLGTENPEGAQPSLNLKGKPNYIEFELINFKLYVDEPGAETMVTIHLSKPAYKYGICYKYDPVDDVWVDYSDNTDFSKNRKTVYLYLTDGGFGDADGIENGIIIDPLAFGSDTSPNIDIDSSGSSGDSFPNIGCFISAALDSSRGEDTSQMWEEIRGRELAIIFSLFVLAFIGKAIARRIKHHHLG